MSKKILAVDDEPSILELVQRALAGKGYEIITGSDGYDAVDQSRLKQPDLIILDIMMPGLNGLEAAKKIAAEPKTAKIPILLLSGVGDLDKQLDALEMLNVEYLTKPFKQHELASFVQAMLDPALKDELEKHRRVQIGKLRAMVEIMHRVD